MISPIHPGTGAGPGLLLTSLLGCLLIAPAPATAEVEVSLSDGSRLRGDLRSASGKGILELESAAFDTVFEIPVESLNTLADLAPVDSRAARQETLLELTDGSRLAGRLVAAGELTLEASNGTRLPVPVAELVVLEHRARQLTGPLSPADWHTKNLVLSAGIAPLMEPDASLWTNGVPARGRLALRWRGDDQSGITLVLAAGPGDNPDVELVRLNTVGDTLNSVNPTAASPRASSPTAIRAPLQIPSEPGATHRPGVLRSFELSWDLRLGFAMLTLADGTQRQIDLDPTTDSSSGLSLLVQSASPEVPVVVDSLALIDGTKTPSLAWRNTRGDEIGIHLVDSSWLPGASLVALEEEAETANFVVALPDGQRLALAPDLLDAWVTGRELNQDGGSSRSDGAAWRIGLDDGSVLFVETFRIQDGQLLIAHPHLGELTYPLGSLATLKPLP